MIASEPLYPLLTERRLVYRMWGGQHIAKWLQLPEPHPSRIGETWEVFDTNRICNGPLAGQTLAHVTRRYTKHLIGTHVYDRYGVYFPLLIKLLDATDRLSLQVHPNDAYVRANESPTEFFGKTEAWYILDAKPNSDIMYGFTETMERERFAASVADGTLETYVEHIPVQTGDVIFTPPGILHAMNKGLFVFEIQQKSDLTYRVYDYGRCDPATGQPRTLHIEKALDVLRYTPNPNPKTVPLLREPGCLLLVACPHFALEHWILDTERFLSTHPATLETLTIIQGEGNIIWADGSMTIKLGDTVILPACLGDYILEPLTEPWHMLRAFVPNIEYDILGPLRQQGIRKSEISRTVFDDRGIGIFS